MALQQELQQRSCPRRLTATSRHRLPLQERPNPPSAAAPQKKKIFLGPTKSSFPRPQDPVPDAPTDYTDLWKAISMAKPPATDKATSKDTVAYSDILYRLGIDIETANIANPEEVVDLSEFE